MANQRISESANRIREEVVALRHSLAIQVALAPAIPTWLLHRYGLAWARRRILTLSRAGADGAFEAAFRVGAPVMTPVTRKCYTV